ncbi:MAG TPA: TIGR03000 domain-containing protein [Gemmataceae bacterium]|nr:TIGR03000 domain-containing protein [Gemmataceae bacterium]
MLRRFWWLGGTAVLVALVLSGNEALAQRGGRGGVPPGSVYRGGAYPGVAYRGGYYPRGYYGGYRPYAYRPYYSFGIGIGFYGYPYGGYGVYAPYYGAYGYAPRPIVVSPPPVYATPAVPSAVPEDAPPADNAAHLRLTVPENAEVWVDGMRTTQSGSVREFASPPLTPGKSFTYLISVRYRAADGQTVNDTRPIHVRANDWFSIDFTRPAPPEQSPAPRQAPSALQGT